MYQLPTQGLALSRAQEMSNTPNASPFLPLGRSVLLDSCLVAQAGEHPSGVGRTQPQEAAHQVWSHTRPGTQLPLKPGWASAEGAGALSTLFTGGVSAGEVPAGPGSRVVGTEGLAYAGGQWYQEGPGDRPVGGEQLDLDAEVLTWLCDPGQVTSPLWDSMATFVKWG